MKKTMLTTLALCGFLLMPTMSHAAQNLTIDLNGQDGKGNFTLILPKTSSNTTNVVYQLDLLHKFGFARRGSLSALYVALGMPDGRLLFFTSFPGISYPIFPYRQVLINNTGHNVSIPNSSFPATSPLFPISQAVVNATPPGTYTFFAVYVDLAFLGVQRLPPSVVGPLTLFDLANHIVSNVAQVSVRIVSKMSKVEVYLRNEDSQNIHIKLRGEPFSSRNRVFPGRPLHRTVQFSTLGDGFLRWEAGRNGVVQAGAECLIRFDTVVNRVTWTGSRLFCSP